MLSSNNSIAKRKYKCQAKYLSTNIKSGDTAGIGAGTKEAGMMMGENLFLKAFGNVNTADERLESSGVHY